MRETGGPARESGVTDPTALRAMAESVVDPELECTLGELSMVGALSLDGAALTVTLALPVAAWPTADRIEDALKSAFADQGASYKAWLRVCQGGYAPSAVAINGAMTSGVEGLTNG